MICIGLPFSDVSKNEEGRANRVDPAQTASTEAVWSGPALFAHVPIFRSYMSLITRKPVFGVSDQVRLKLACSADETSQGLKISDIETRDIILSRQRTTKVLIRLRGCSWRGSYGKIGVIQNIWALKTTIVSNILCEMRGVRLCY